MSAADYTPTWFEVREEYAQGDVHRETEFDRWLAAHDAEVAAKALEEAARVAERYTPGYSKHPDDPVIERTKRAIAEQIRKAAEQ